ncbi:hypothetical protein [Adhaeretor mobilis]|uniref:ATP synthase protein I n=1 Tax=Adhaeretor mobilis TaxID=1930276 RepID=A0A517MXT5_9BACT|nr:hypothetical protein [Adhaeretor mobilis]QDS99692.1 hypothetical protein HG15A2_30190 [Adhaeretor mobilis]
MTGIWKPALILGIVFVVVAAIAAGVTAGKYGSDAYLSCGLAAAVVWLAGTIGLVLTSLASDAHSRLNALLMGMLVRLGLPLASLVIVPQMSERLAAAGFAGLVLVFYLVGLVVETPLLMGLVKKAQDTSEKPPVDPLSSDRFLDSKQSPNGAAL